MFPAQVAKSGITVTGTAQLLFDHPRREVSLPNLPLILASSSGSKDESLLAAAVGRSPNPSLLFIDRGNDRPQWEEGRIARQRDRI